MSNAPRSPSRVYAYLRKSLRQLVWALLVFSLLGYLGSWHRLLELFCHFRLQYLWCAVLGGIALLLFRDFRTPLVALASFGINAVEVLPWYFGKPPAPSATAPALKLLLSNVYTDNRETAPLLDLITRENPDVIVLQEIDDRWVGELRSLEKAYPNFKTVPEDKNFGIGVWTRLPAKIRLFEPNVRNRPTLLVQFSVGTQEIALTAIHAVPPLANEWFKLRNEQLASVAHWSRTVPGPRIVLGDLNATLWSPFLKSFARDSGLHNARQGFGVLPSWPTMVPFMKIPLDQCFISPDLAVRAIRTGPKIGSDHLPLIIELAL